MFYLLKTKYLFNKNEAAAEGIIANPPPIYAFAPIHKNSLMRNKLIKYTKTYTNTNLKSRAYLKWLNTNFPIE
jgi:hypothetical protein